MQKTVDVFFSFRSPYSYLVTPDLLRLRNDFDINVALRPVMPIAIRDKGAVFDASDKKRPRYITMDSKRRADFLGLPYRWPRPDPVIQNMETFEVAEEQPLIWQLTRLAIAAEQEGKGIDFAHDAALMLWSGTDNWHQGDHLAKVCDGIGLDIATLSAAINQSEAETQVEKNHADLEAAGHWGVPTMVFEGEPFFGQDRIGTLRWRLDQAALTR